MKKTLLTLLVCLMATSAFAGSILYEGFEYANQDLTCPIGWVSDDGAWLCGYMEKDHNRLPHSGNWYAFSNGDDAWMYMPTYLFTSMRYRFTLWAISDGDFQLEIWGGSEPSPNAMTQLSTTAITGDEYQKVSAYVTDIPADCQYFAFRAVRGDRGSYLTIDDIDVDMVEQYTFEAEAITGDTAMYPGTQATFRYLVHNSGYDPVDITMHPSNEFFTDFTCSHNGLTSMTIPTEPDEIVEVTMTATLRPEIEPGTVAWLDIQMTIPCNCNTAMVTFWVTPLDVTLTDENNAIKMNVFPNPTTDYVTIEAEGIREITIVDVTGRLIKTMPYQGSQANLDMGTFDEGMYFVLVKTKKGIAKRTIVKR